MEDGGIRREDEVSGKIRMIDEDREMKMGEQAIKGGRMRALKGGLLERLERNQEDFGD